MIKNKEYTGEVSALGSEGEGMIRNGDEVAFVPYCLPGERVSFSALKVRGGVAYGKLTEVHTLSPDRAAPACAVYEKCGGCQLQHMKYAAQLRFKRQTVQNCLKKIGGLETEVGETVASDRQYGYRNKLAVPVGKGAHGETVVGFYAPRSHRIVPVTECPLQRGWARDLLACLRTFMHEYGVEGYDEATGKGVVRHIVGREIKGRYIVTVVAAQEVCLDGLEKLLTGKLGEFTLLLNLNRSASNVIFGKEWRVLRGEGFYTAEDCGVRYKAGANTFVQINDDVRAKLYAAVVDAAADKNAVAIDLYSGGGMLTAMLARVCKQAYGIEIVQEAVACADELREMNGLQGKMFNLCGSVEEKLGGVFAQTEGAERVVVCDPPRKGMERSVVNAIIACGAEKVVLVSCDPATLARDLGLLCGSLKEVDGQLVKNAAYGEDGEAGAYRIVSVTPFDMFPQTKHVETLVVLSKKNSRQSYQQ